MKSKLLLLIGAAVGYVFGTRAGRERYLKLRGQAKTLWNKPAVQQQVEVAQAKVKEQVPVVQEKLTEATKAATQKVVDLTTQRGGPAGKDSQLNDSGAGI